MTIGNEDDDLDALPPPKRLTPEERAALDARDARLLEQFIAREPVAEETAKAVAEHAYDVVCRYRPWLLPRFEDFSQRILEKLFRERMEKRLRGDLTLYALARRLVKAEGDKEAGAVRKESAALSFDDTTVKAVPRDVLETEATLAVRNPFKNPERAVAARQQRDWVISAAGGMGETEAETFAHLWAVCLGEHDSLGSALGIEDGAARQRLLRFRRELAAHAETTGAVDLMAQLDSRVRGKAAPPPRAQKETPTRRGHRLEELTLYREGELTPEQASELEKHLPECEECLRSLRALDATRSVLNVGPLVPMSDWDPQRVAAELERKYGPRSRSKAAYWLAAALAAAAAAVAAWSFRSHPEPKPQRQQPVYAPHAPPKDDAGVDGGG